MVDARGLLCPMPVVMVQKAVKDGHPPRSRSCWTTPAPWRTSRAMPTVRGYTVTSVPEGPDTV